MKINRCFHRARARWRRLTAAGLLPLVVAVALGLPMGSVIRKNTSQPFPCQDCPCSCQDAETCWRNCCCMSDREKIAWAQRHGVVPPEFIRDRERNRAVADGMPPAARHMCCGNSTQSDSGRQTNRVSRPTMRRIVLLTAEQRCRGIHTLTAILAMALPANTRTAWNPDDGLSAVVVIRTSLPHNPDFAPPDPPPRSSG